MGDILECNLQTNDLLMNTINTETQISTYTINM